MTHRHDNPIHMTRRAVLAVMAGGATILVGCGGGAADGASGASGAGGAGDTGGGLGSIAGPIDTQAGTGSVAGISSGGTGSFATGTVSGLGSIIVRGIRYDDSHATVEREDEGVVGTVLPGMVVSIRGSGITAASSADGLATATAMRICYASEWVGKVDAIDAGDRRLTVLGQRIDIAANAVFDGDVVQLSSVTTAHFVEAHGYLDLSSGRLLATRLEVSSTAPASYRLSGQVSALDPIARTFRVGTASIAYDAALVLPAGWSNGQLVRVTLARSQVAGMWVATRIRRREALLPELQVEDHSEAVIEGTVTGIGLAGTFAVNGIPVDATGIAITGALLLGGTVEVRGSTMNGVVIATRVDVKSVAQVLVQSFEFIGAVSNLNILTRTFTLKGLDFRYPLGIRIDVLGWLTGATPLARVQATQVDGEWVASEIRQP